MKKAYFAGGCFWCITPVYKEMDGVLDVTCGYCGGITENPTYEEVKQQITGHRETISIEYDENKVSFKDLISVFLDSVDPFDGGGKFIDRGESYTLAIFCNDVEEEKIALSMFNTLEFETGKAVMIEVIPFDCFYKAEEYHQDYYIKNPDEFHKEMVESGRLTEN